MHAGAGLGHTTLLTGNGDEHRARPFQTSNNPLLSWAAQGATTAHNAVSESTSQSHGFGLISVASRNRGHQSEASAITTAVDSFRDAKAPRSGSDQGSAYDDFRTQYLNLEPEVADSPAMLQALIELNGFDWLNRLVEETLDEEPIEAERPQPQPQTQQPQQPVVHSDQQAA